MGCFEHLARGGSPSINCAFGFAQTRRSAPSVGSYYLAYWLDGSLGRWCDYFLSEG